MRKTARRIVFALIVFAVLIYVMIAYLAGKPLLPKDSHGQVTVADVAVYAAEGPIYLGEDDYDLAALLEYLDNYKVRWRAWNPSHLYSSAGTSVQIVIRYKEKPITIYMANKVLVNYGGCFDYTVQQPAAFSKAVAQILDPAGRYGLN